MFLNERTIPLNLQQIIAVRSRISKNHSKQPRLEKSELKSWAGFHGERTVDRLLEKFANDKYTIITDLNLQAKKMTLFKLTPFSTPHISASSSKSKISLALSILINTPNK